MLAPALRRLSPENAQGEYYLTDVVEVLHDAGYGVSTFTAEDPAETQGVNDRVQLAGAEAELRRRTNDDWLRRGVTMVDPSQHVRRRDRAARARRHPVPGHDPAGQHRGGGSSRDRAGHAGSSTAWSGEDAIVEQSTGRDAEIGAGCTGRPVSPSCSRVRPWPRALVTGPFYTALVPTTGLDRPEGDGLSNAMELVTKKRLLVYSGSCHPMLADDIAAHLGVELGEPNLRQFSNGELHCRYGDSIRGADVFIIQTHGSPNVNDAIMEQLIMIDAAKRASAKRITAVCPFYGYARQDRKAEGREPITAKLRGRHADRGRRQSRRLGRSAHRPDPGLLRRAGRPSDRPAGAGRLPARPRVT